MIRERIYNTPDIKEKGKWLVSKQIDNVRLHTRAGKVWEQINNRCKEGTEYGNLRLSLYGKQPKVLFDDFQQFAEWCQTQFGYWKQEENTRFWSIDKDIILPKNKDYGPDLCLFVPKSVNKHFRVKSKGGTAELFGATLRDGGKFFAQAPLNGKNTYLGLYETEQQAHKQWQKMKIVQLMEAYNLPEIADHKALLNALDYRIEILCHEYYNDFPTVW